MLDAKNARRIAKERRPEVEKSREILEEVRKAAEEGKFYTFYYIKDYDFAFKVKCLLVELGYRVKIDIGLTEAEYALTIYW